MCDLWFDLISGTHIDFLKMDKFLFVSLSPFSVFPTAPNGILIDLFC